MVHYKLFYFNARGRAELARYLFAAGGVEYEDVRFDKDEWVSTYKPKSPLGQSPFLEIHDGSNVATLAQSITIARYLGRKFDLAGKGELEQAEVEMYADQVSDLYNAFGKAFLEKDETRKAELLKTLYEETVPAQFALFESRLAKVGSGYLAATGLTYADLHLTLAAETVVQADKREQVFSKFPHLKKLVESVNSHPRIAAWIAKRPVTQM